MTQQKNLTNKRKVIGKTFATERTPATMDVFYFWTQSDQILNPFDVVKVEHLSNSVTFGVVEEISHMTDATSLLTDYISSDFGDLNAPQPTLRVGMNCVKAKVIENTGRVYTPVLDGRQVCLATKEEIAQALGIHDIEYAVPCGYIEMYAGLPEEDKVMIPVKLDPRYLIGPEGAHLNISGISGLAAKTSFAMFLLKGIQDRAMRNELNDDVAFIVFNVKGRDLLALDQTESTDESVTRQYKDLDLIPEALKNVRYFFPANPDLGADTYLPESEMPAKFRKSRGYDVYQYEYRRTREKLDLLFTDIDDSTQTMGAILDEISRDDGPFSYINDWRDFGDTITKFSQAKNGGSKEITVQSWRKFSRIVNRALANPLFGNGADTLVDLQEQIKRIQKNDVYVIDIARLSEPLQAFVFGDVLRAAMERQLGSDDADVEQSSERKQLRLVIFIDELNKYASKDASKNSPILRNILDIAERGRSLGLVLFGAEQFKSAVNDRVTGNCSTHAYGRTNAIELSKKAYEYIPPIYKSMATRLQQGEYIVQNPIFRTLLHIKFPPPIYRQFK